MDAFKLAIVTMAIVDTQWERKDCGNGRREMTAEELNAVVDFGWHWPDMGQFVQGCVNAVLPRWRSPSLERVEGAELASAETR